MVPPSFNDDLSLTQRVEDFTVEQFVSHPPVETLAVAVLPGRPRFDICGFCPNGFDPASNRFSNELRAVVRPDVGWNATKDEQICQGVDDLSGVQLSFHPDCQTFPAVLIQDVERSKGPAIIGSVVNEVI